MLANVTTPLAGGQNRTPLRILWIGNSHTNLMGQNPDLLLRKKRSLPLKISEWAKKRGHSVECAEAAIGGYALKDHWRNPKSMQKLIQGRWDYVVVQENGRGPIGESEAAMKKYVGLFNMLIREKEAQPVLYMTHSYRGCPDNEDDCSEWLPTMQAAVTRAYKQCADTFHTYLAPLGVAHDEVKQERPDINLYYDVEHHSFEALYLAASVFMVTLFGENPAGLPAFSDWPVKPEVIEYLQQKAWDVCRRPEWRGYLIPKRFILR
jgi:hypothetical protein